MTRSLSATVRGSGLVQQSVYVYSADPFLPRVPTVDFDSNPWYYSMPVVTRERACVVLRGLDVGVFAHWCMRMVSALDMY